MTAISASELDLLTFFECEPELQDDDVPWVYNDALYQFSAGDYSISCAVAPSYKDVRLIFKNNEETLYELNAVGVDDVKYHNDGGRETLEIVIKGSNRLWLHLKPAISVAQVLKEL